MPIDDTATFEIQVNTAPSTARIQKLSICWSGRFIHPAGTQYHGVTQPLSAREFIGKHFDVVSANNNVVTEATQCKAYALSYYNQGLRDNPTIKVLGYYDSQWTWPGLIEQVTNETAFVHYKNSPYPRIAATSYPNNRLMYPGSVYWRQFLKDIVYNNCTGGYSIYDGFFMDDTAYNCGGYDLTRVDTGATINKTTDLEDSYYANWNTSLDGHMSYLRSSTPGNKILLANIGYSWSLPTLGPIVQNPLYEGFVHSSWRAYNNDNDWPPSMIITTIGYLRGLADQGIPIAVISETGSGTGFTYPTESYNWMRIAFACFTFAVALPSTTIPNPMERAYYAHNFYGQDSHFGQYDEMDYNLGNPVANYYHVTTSTSPFSTTGSYIYVREFDNYYVLVNMGTLGTAAVNVSYNGTPTYSMVGKSAEFIPKT